MRPSVPVATLVVAVLALAASPGPPDPAGRQSLADGYWHGSVGQYDFIYEFRVAEGDLGGATHQIENGRQRTAMAMTSVSFDGRKLEIGYSAMPPYRGEVDLENGRIEGGHPGARRFSDLSLTRVDPADWPMVAAKPPPATGEPVYSWARPAELDDGWTTGEPEDVDIDATAVERAVGAILAGDAGWLHSLLIVRHGRLVVEEYFHGWQADDLHRLASCTKSVSSLLVGIAIDRGEIAGVDAPLLTFFPEYSEAAGEGWEKLRLEHLLTMSMALDWTEEEADGFPSPDQDRFADVVARNVEAEPGTRFRYVSRNTNLLSKVLRQATGAHADVFAAKHLFAPLGIRSWHWQNNRWEGYPDMSGTLKLRPRDMAKLGKLVLDRGVWRGRRVVSSEWIDESTIVRFRPSADDEYGYLWWGFDEPPPGVDFATGKGSQYILVLPAFDMVLVTTGGNEYNEQHSSVLAVIKEHLAPGLRQPDLPPDRLGVPGSPAPPRGG